MIPKVVHYCWFGRNPKLELMQRCIASWKKHCPDYELIEWNEDNFDVNIIPYTQEAYEAKKYAFVSDYARMWILYHYGGLYFDTDVEVIKEMDDIVVRGPFMGIEVEAKGDEYPLVAPGLGLGAEPMMDLYRNIMDYYAPLHFVCEDGSFNQVTVVKHVTNVLADNGLKQTNELQEVGGVWIYPREYFNPLDDNTGKLVVTENTRSIHWYTKTWLNKQNPIRTWIVRRIHRYFGNDSLGWLKRVLGR